MSKLVDNKFSKSHNTEVRNYEKHQNYRNTWHLFEDDQVNVVQSAIQYFLTKSLSKLSCSQANESDDSNSLKQKYFTKILL